MLLNGAIMRIDRRAALFAPIVRADCQDRGAIVQGSALFLHIAGGGLALVAGAAALAARKGGRLHGKAGTLFLSSMLVMAMLGGMLAAIKPDRLSTVSALLALYLVATGWETARRRDGRLGRIGWSGFALACGCATADVCFGLQAASLPDGRLDGWPPAAYFVFALVAALGAGLDLNVHLRDGVTGPRRIARHLWRMCAALFMASGSFFFGQQKVMPEALQGSTLLTVLGLAPLGFMIFWLLRVRLARLWRRRRAAAGGAGLSRASREGSARSTA